MWVKTIRNLILIFGLVVILCFSLLVITYMLPNENAHEIMVRDATLFSNEWPMIINSYQTTKLDLFSDSLILSEISYYNKNISLVDNSMSVYGAIGGYDTFQRYCGGDESVTSSYAIYWHGNLVVLKPLFYFLDYEAVIVLELFFELVIIVGIIKLMFENNLKDYIIPFILSLSLIHYAIVGLCIQLSVMFTVMLISVYILLKFKENLFKNNRLFYYFLVVGMATNFFDLSSAPLISFGMPIIFYILLKDKTTLKDNILKILLFGMVWSLGYVGMWISKWIIASFILDENIVLIALKQFIFRTSTATLDSKFSRLDAILNNLLIYKKKSYLIIFASIGIYYTKRLIIARKNITRNNIKEIMPFTLIASMPFIWYFLASNHSYIHY